MSETLTIAAAQYPIGQPASLEEWKSKIIEWVAEGSATGANLLVFPEYAAIEQAAALGNGKALERARGSLPIRPF